MELTGEIKTIVYRNADNGFTVLELTDASGDEITAVGPIALAQAGERVRLSGEWTEHRAYGRQFKADSCETLAPSDISALINYLSSGLIRGVGLPTAQAIVNTFGMDTLSIIENYPERLCEVPGIGRMRAGAIVDSYMQQREMRDVMLSLQSLGVSIAQAVKIYKLYGPLCLARIEENPYRLIEDIESIGFKTADRIAAKAGIAPDSGFRLKAGLHYTLSWAKSEGHTFLPRERLIAVACELLNMDIAPMERALDEMIIEGRLVCRLVDGMDAVFTTHMFYQEKDCALRLTQLMRTEPESAFMDLEKQISMMERQWGVMLADEQRMAVTTALKSGAMVITGGPGTGKTTILRFIIRLMEKLGLDFELCAPTGRAAKRMSEATGHESRTIHRLLEYGFASEGFVRNEENPLYTDMVIVDEMSMVDVPLMHALLRSLSPGTRLIMVGDADQLPPVGAGNALKDIIAAGAVPVIRLNEVFRQARRSMIVTNAHRINRGEEPLLDNSSSDFLFEQTTDPQSIINRMLALFTRRVRLLFADDPLKDAQALAPMKKGLLGVKNLNQVMQAALNPPSPAKRERPFGDRIFREGDKVMQIKNNYRMEWMRKTLGNAPETGIGVFNGDMGVITNIDAEQHTLEVIFDDERAVSYDFTQLEELELAYCISIHKSQGSEFPAVVLPLLGGAPMLMTRNLLYTAVTRAQSQVYVIGARKCLTDMVNNASVRRRYSALSIFLKECMESYA